MAQHKVEESQRKLVEVTSKNWNAVSQNGSHNNNHQSNNHVNSHSNNHHNNHHTNGNGNYTNSSNNLSSESFNNSNNHLVADDNDNDEDNEHRKEGGVELKTSESLPPEPNRETMLERNQNIKQKLEEERREMNQARVPTKLTKEDAIHQENVREGRDKYKTLKQIRQGNTKKRIDEFESM